MCYYPVNGYRIQSRCLYEVQDDMDVNAKYGMFFGPAVVQSSFVLNTLFIVEMELRGHHYRIR